jgi:hypothetical protein
VPPPVTFDRTSPTVSITAPANGATVTGTVTITATASDTVVPNTTDTVGLVGLQFQLEGINMAAIISGPGPTYTLSWNTSTTPSGAHTLTAIAIDEVGNTGTSTISVTVGNVGVSPVISGVRATSITSSGATITWTSDKASNSQVAYGTTSAYGSMSGLGTALVTSHSVNLSGLTASTTYHYKVLSRDGQGNLASSGDFTFTTAAVSGGPQPVLQLHADATEVSGIIKGSIVTPGTAPSGFTGTVAVKGTGSVNFTPAQVGSGVYFLNCCDNTNVAYYKFAGATVGSVFNVNQGQISFYLKSRYSFAQRQTSAASSRFAFDVRDNDVNNHLFYFLTQAGSGGYLTFSYKVGGAAQYYYVAKGTEDTLFGNGVVLKVTMSWDGAVSKLYFNDGLVQSSSYTKPVPNWTGASNFDLGAYEYAMSGGFNVSDDVIDEFTVSP